VSNTWRAWPPKEEEEGEEVFIEEGGKGDEGIPGVFS